MTLTTQAHKCLCGRILLPTRDGHWPHHYHDPHHPTKREWCPLGGREVRP